MNHLSGTPTFTRRFVGLFALAFGLAPRAWSQSYPSRPVRVIVPYTPGGGTDVWGRMVAQKMSERLKQPFIVENKAGANGLIGTDYVAKATPDGYTLAFVSGSSLTDTFYKSPPFDLLRDLEPVGQTHAGAMFVMVNSRLPVHSLKELIDYTKKNPGKMGYASAGVTNKLAMEAFKKSVGIDINEIPYKGSGDSAVALASGQVDVSFDVLLAYKPFIESGKVRVLAVAADRRYGILPDVPTTAEAGVPGFRAEFSGGLWAPAGTPKPIIETLNQNLVEIVKLPDVQQRFRFGAAEPVGSSAAAHRKQVQSEIDFWRAAAKAVNFKPEM